MILHLFIFELGYYQSTAEGFGLEPVDIEQVSELVNDAAKVSIAPGIKCSKQRLMTDSRNEKKPKQNG